MDFYIFEDYYDLGNLPLVNTELSNFVFLVALKLDVSIFTTDEEKEEKINSSTMFEECYLNLNLRRKIWKFLTLDNLNTQKIELHKNPC